MIVKHIFDIIGTRREVQDPAGKWISRRLLLKEDEMGFSLHYTIVKEMCELQLHYKNHLEAVYCISGEGQLRNLETDEVHKLRSGLLYALNRNEKHLITSKKEMHMICVFNPPLTGEEVHTEEGSYELLGE